MDEEVSYLDGFMGFSLGDKSHLDISINSGDVVVVREDQPTTIAGKVVAKIPEPMRVCSITLQLEGIEEVCWVDGEGKDYRYFSERSICLQKSWTLFEPDPPQRPLLQITPLGRARSALLQPGTYEYPFELTLDERASEQLPPSALVDAGRITYIFRASIRRPWYHSNLYLYRMLNVVRENWSLALALMSPLTMGPSTSSDVLSISSTVSSTIAPPGHPLPVSLVIRKAQPSLQQQVVLVEVRVSLSQHTIVHAADGTASRPVVRRLHSLRVFQHPHVRRTYGDSYEEDADALSRHLSATSADPVLLDTTALVRVPLSAQQDVRSRFLHLSHQVDVVVRFLDEHRQLQVARMAIPVMLSHLTVDESVPPAYPTVASDLPPPYVQSIPAGCAA